MKIIKYLDDIGAQYLAMMAGGMIFFSYILWKGMIMHPNGGT